MYPEWLKEGKIVLNEGIMREWVLDDSKLIDHLQCPIC
jgi:hypothetical protein